VVLSEAKPWLMCRKDLALPEKDRSGRHLSFTMITAAARNQLFGLDKKGKVWKYIPEDKDKMRWAFWTRLTDWGSGASVQQKESNGDEQEN